MKAKSRVEYGHSTEKEVERGAIGGGKRKHKKEVRAGGVLEPYFIEVEKRI